MISIFTDLFEIDGKKPEGIETKVCAKCKKNLPITKFGKASGGNYYRGECKSCAKELTIAREKAKLSAPKVEENHICPICERTEEQVRNRGGKKSGSWCCDHSHTTGKFRGWICHDCNRGIGNLGDDIDRLHRAIKYIQR
jgi:hypothetical protein